MVRWIVVGLMLGLTVLSSGEVEKFQVEKSENDRLIENLYDYVLGYSDSRQGRTFGQKRIQFMLMPMMYKMGVMTTMLTFLTVISTKTLIVGLILLVMKVSMFFGKFYASMSQQHTQWSPAHPVHVHMHGNSGHHTSHSYNPWEHSSSPEHDDYYYKG